MKNVEYAYPKRSYCNYVNRHSVKNGFGISVELLTCQYVLLTLNFTQIISAVPKLVFIEGREGRNTTKQLICAFF